MRYLPIYCAVELLFLLGLGIENGLSEHAGGLAHLINTECGLVYVVAALRAQRQGEASDAVSRKRGP